MTRRFLFISLSFLSLFGFGQDSRDHEAVEKVVAAFQKDYNDGFQSEARYTTADWEHINPEGGISKGRENVLLDVRNVHQTFLKGVTMQIEDMVINFPVADVAVANVVHRVGNYTTPDGLKHENERQFKTYVVVYKRGKWLLFQDHATYIQN